MVKNEGCMHNMHMLDFDFVKTQLLPIIWNKPHIPLAPTT